MFTLSRDASAISKRIVALHKLGTVYREQQHELAMDCLVHVAEHRNPVLLNRFYSGLSENDKQAFRNYVAKFQYEMAPSGKDGKLEFVKDAANKRVPTDLIFLSFSRTDGFTVVQNTVENGKRFVAHAEKHLLNPTEQRYAPFWQADNVADERQLFMNDAKAVAAIKALVAKIVKPKEGTIGQVSKATADLLNNTVAKLEAMTSLPDIVITRDDQKKADKELASIIGHRMTELEDETQEPKSEEIPAEVPPAATLPVKETKSRTGSRKAA